jgi:hypothetical protein
MLFSVSYLNDLILIVRTVKQIGLKIGINGGSGDFVVADFYKNVGTLGEGLQGVGMSSHHAWGGSLKVLPPIGAGLTSASSWYRARSRNSPNRMLAANA